MTRTIAEPQLLILPGINGSYPSRGEILDTLIGCMFCILACVLLTLGVIIQKFSLSEKNYEVVKDSSRPNERTSINNNSFPAEVTPLFLNNSNSIESIDESSSLSDLSQLLGYIDDGLYSTTASSADVQSISDDPISTHRFYNSPLYITKDNLVLNNNNEGLNFIENFTLPGNSLLAYSNFPPSYKEIPRNDINGKANREKGNNNNSNNNNKSEVGTIDNKQNNHINKPKDKNLFTNEKIFSLDNEIVESHNNHKNKLHISRTERTEIKSEILNNKINIISNIISNIRKSNSESINLIGPLHGKWRRYSSSIPFKQYTPRVTWFCGVGIYVTGQIVGMIALAFSPPSILACVSSLSLLLNYGMSIQLLGEKGSRDSFMGTIMIMIGTVVMVECLCNLHSHIENGVKNHTGTDLKRIGFLDMCLSVPYVVAVLTTGLIISFFSVIESLSQSGRPAFQATKAAFLGSIGITLTRSVVGTIPSLLENDENPHQFAVVNMTAFSTLSVIGASCDILSVWTMNCALQKFPSISLIPTYYGIAMIIQAVLGIIYSQRYHLISACEILGGIIGSGITIYGIRTIAEGLPSNG